MIDMQANIKAAAARLGPPTPEQITRLQLIFSGAPTTQAAAEEENADAA
ncbi:hypothetical protein [Nonomuraea rhizosphaerae]|nr:hypothetical protein [Nonomuraea rhizosphaerae]